MALFKIFKGKSSNLPTSYVNGYCYFTIDDGKMYIDAENNSKIERIVLNAYKADKLNCGKVGDTNKPIYFDEGLPQPCGDSLAVSITKNAATATKFSSSRNIKLQGDVTGEKSTTGESGWTIDTTLKNSGITAGSYGPSANKNSTEFEEGFTVPYITFDAKGRATTASNKTITMPGATATTSKKGLMSINDKKNVNYFIAGTQTASTGSWTGTCADITELYDGLTIRYYLPYAGSGNASLALNGGTAYPIYRYGVSTRITTHFPAGSIITMTFRTSYNVSGSTKTNAWIVDAFYDSSEYAHAISWTNASTAAKIGTMSSYNLEKNRYFILRLSNGNSYAGAITLNVASKGAKPIYINGTASSASNYSLPSGSYWVYYDGTNYHIRTDGYLSGNLAGRATQDDAGQTITSTYIKGLSVSGKTITYTKGDGKTATITTQDTTYALATQSANGLLAKEDKVKIDNLETTYVKLNGGGTISSDTFGPLIIKRNNTNYAGIGFENSNGRLGYIAMNTKDGNLVRYNSSAGTNYTILDTQNYSGLIDGRYVNTAGDTMSGLLTANAGVNSSFNASKKYYSYDHVDGGQYISQTQKVTGYLKITLPVSWTNTMMKFDVFIFNYLTNTSTTYTLAGYNYATESRWANCTAYSNGAQYDRMSLPVKFGHDGTQCAIYIGNADTEWNYPQVRLSNILVGYSGAFSAFASGWNISFTTTLGTISSTILDPSHKDKIVADTFQGNATSATTATVANRLTNARTVTLAGDATGSFSYDGSANSTLTVTVVDDSHNHVISNIDNLQSTLNAKAPLASPALTGTPTAPTAAVGTNTTQIATTAFVKAACDKVLTSELTFKGSTSTLPSSPTNGDMWKASAAIAKTSAMDAAAKIGDTLIYSSNDSLWHIIPSGDDIEDTWRTIQVNGTQLKGGGTSTGVINFKSGTNVTVSGSGNDITFAAVNTKNTAGSTNSTSKLFLIGATNQAANPQTYSSSKVYVTDGTVTATTFSGALSGNATTATSANKLTTARTINGTSFDGSANITTTNWGTARNIGIVNSDGTGTAVTTSVNGSGNVNLKLPATIKATLQGNADTATTFASAKSVTLIGDVTGTTSSKGGWSIATTLANSGVAEGTYGPSADVTGSNNNTISIPQITVDAKGRIINITDRTYTSIDTNTTYSLTSFGITATSSELNKLDGVTATTTELNYIDGVTSNIQTQLNNKQAKHLTVTASLAVANWSNKSITVSVSNVTASNTIVVSPDPTSYTAYVDAGIRCTAQATGKLTFTCDTVPTTVLLVNVAILN